MAEIHHKFVSDDETWLPSLSQHLQLAEFFRSDPALSIRMLFLGALRAFGSAARHQVRIGIGVVT